MNDFTEVQVPTGWHRCRLSAEGLAAQPLADDEQLDVGDRLGFLWPIEGDFSGTRPEMASLILPVEMATAARLAAETLGVPVAQFLEANTNFSHFDVSAALRRQGF